ncbi:ABC transporter I family member 21 [Acorus calamus]|uniref:ABC transporter I family member 21 n=1 Tax=Acorus calamus TaxID=4465 RepID=A0AAV9ET98_ACOCL|nr:ABC transporter I family member 21 [Acorus calamus]
MGSGGGGGIEVTGLNFAYDERLPFFVNFNLEVPHGSRCLLIGANGSDSGGEAHGGGKGRGSGARSIGFSRYAVGL